MSRLPAQPLIQPLAQRLAPPTSRPMTQHPTSPRTPLAEVAGRGPVRRPWRPGAVSAASLAGLLLAVPALGACGADGSDGVDDSAAGSVGAASGVPEVCATAFPLAFGSPDTAALTLLPKDWPEPPTGATLCQTTATPDGSVQTADFATESSGHEVLAAYEAALAPAYDVTREDQGAGEVLSGSGRGIVFEVSTRDGAYSIALSAG